MTAKQLMEVGEKLNVDLDGLGLAKKPELYLVVTKDEFEKLDFQVYYSLNKTANGYEQSEDELVLNFVNCIVHIFYDQEKAEDAQSDRAVKTETKKKRFSLLSYFKGRKS
jgi:hypothetical protein